jgi:hypothetical protein
MNSTHEDAKTAAWYVILVKGYLDERRAAWFDGMEIELLPDGFTQIAGRITDQAALFGRLAQVRDLGLELWKVDRIVRQASGGSGSVSAPNPTD